MNLSVREMVRSIILLPHLKFMTKVFIFLGLLYITATLFGGYKLIQNKRQAARNLNEISDSSSVLLSRKKSLLHSGRARPALLQQDVEIWGKAAIGLYLWQHVLGGQLQDERNGLVRVGKLTVQSLSFVFRSGPGLVPNTAPRRVSHLILVVNGRSQDKVNHARVWLDSLSAFEELKHVALVMLGNEKCENDWVLPYMRSKGGLVDVCFITYDSPLIDNKEFFQWPLGVAVYRGFPDVDPERLDVTSTRPYLCNFLGTVYHNSSRQQLSKIVFSSEKLQEQCLVIGRKKWQPLETEPTRTLYIDSLLKSDLTLSPVGINTECYRIFEALSLGSIPVVEDVMTPGHCDADSALTPLRLLKAHGAPLLYLQDWKHLPSLLVQESQLTYQDKVLRRQAAVLWYKTFKNTMAENFVKIISEKFFNH